MPAVSDTEVGAGASVQSVDRALTILELLARGRRTTEIAAELFLSPKTVANNMTSIFAKLQVALAKEVRNICSRRASPSQVREGEIW